MPRGKKATLATHSVSRCCSTNHLTVAVRHSWDMDHFDRRKDVECLIRAAVIGMSATERLLILFTRKRTLSHPRGPFPFLQASLISISDDVFVWPEMDR